MTTSKGITKCTVPIWMLTMFYKAEYKYYGRVSGCNSDPHSLFSNYTSKLQFLSVSVVLLYKILGFVFFNSAISLPVCCNAYRNTEQSAVTLKHD